MGARGHRQDSGRGLFPAEGGSSSGELLRERIDQALAGEGHGV